MMLQKQTRRSMIPLTCHRSIQFRPLKNGAISPVKAPFPHLLSLIIWPPRWTTGKVFCFRRRPAPTMKLPRMRILLEDRRISHRAPSTLDLSWVS